MGSTMRYSLLKLTSDSYTLPLSLPEEAARAGDSRRMGGIMSSSYGPTPHYVAQWITKHNEYLRSVNWSVTHARIHDSLVLSWR
jgi:hypothetical protein